MSVYVDWYDVVKDVHPLCTTAGYRRDEEENLTPALKAAGYEPTGGWFTGDGDSFGPLTRCIRAVDPAGQAVIVVYG